MRPCLLIAGPTAAGKTALSLAAAERLNGEIINADSMQIYEGLHILTARPDAQEEARAPHHLFGTIAPDRRFSVGEWLDASLALIAEIRSRGRTPILVGGTGLYFNALTKGLAPVPEIDDAARERAEALINQQGFEALRAEALRADPLAAERVEPADRQRLQRIVEVFYTTGAALSSFWDKTEPALPEGDWRGLVLELDRAQLYARIERRFDLMLEQGGLEEVAAFAERRLDRDLPAMKALGVPPLLAHLAGEMTLADAVEISKRDSRRYAKRQSTWFRNQNGSWPRITSLDSETAIAALETILEGE